MTKSKEKRFATGERLYPTEKEEQTFRRLKEEYGLTDTFRVRREEGRDSETPPQPALRAKSRR